MRDRTKTKSAKLPRMITPKVESLFKDEPEITKNVQKTSCFPPNFGKVGDGLVFPGAKSRDISKPLIKLYQSVVDSFTQARKSLDTIELALGSDTRLTNAKKIIENLFEEWRDENEMV